MSTLFSTNFLNYEIKFREYVEMSCFSDKIKELRKLKGVTQKQVAASVGMSDRAYRYLESGANNPSRMTITALAKYFDVAIDELRQVN